MAGLRLPGRCRPSRLDLSRRHSRQRRRRGCREWCVDQEGRRLRGLAIGTPARVARSRVEHSHADVVMPAVARLALVAPVAETLPRRHRGLQHALLRHDTRLGRGPHLPGVLVDGRLTCGMAERVAGQGLRQGAHESTCSTHTKQCTVRRAGCDRARHATVWQSCCHEGKTHAKEPKCNSCLQHVGTISGTHRGGFLGLGGGQDCRGWFLGSGRAFAALGGPPGWGKGKGAVGGVRKFSFAIFFYAPAHGWG